MSNKTEPRARQGLLASVETYRSAAGLELSQAAYDELSKVYHPPVSLRG